MEIIDELEPHKRGAYGGAVGYIDFRGNLDTCIVIRTVVVKGAQHGGEQGVMRRPEFMAALREFLAAAR